MFIKTLINIYLIKLQKISLLYRIHGPVEHQRVSTDRPRQGAYVKRTIQKL